MHPSTLRVFAGSPTTTVSAGELPKSSQDPTPTDVDSAACLSRMETDALEDEFFDLIGQWSGLSPQAKRAILATAKRQINEA